MKLRHQLRHAAIFLVEYEIWPVTAAVGASIAAERLLPLALIVILAFWPIRWIAWRRWTQRTPADHAVVMLALMIPVTLWATALPGKTIPQIYRLLSGIGFYYALANWIYSKNRLRLAGVGVALAGSGLAILALFSVQWFVSKLPFIPAGLYSRLPLLASDTIHPNVLAGYLILLLPIAAGVLLFDRRGLSRIEAGIYLISAFLMAAVIILTQSRGAILGFSATLAVLACLRWRRGWIVLVLFLALIGITIALLGVPWAAGVVNASNSAINSAEGRIDAWSRAIDMIRDFPFTGVGMGLFGDVADRLYPFLLSEPGSIPHAHNLFLQVAVDLGLPGLAAWLGVLAAVTYSTVQTYRFSLRCGDHRSVGIAVGLLAGQAALVTHGLLDAVTWGMVRPAPLVWGLWGLAIATQNFKVHAPHDEELTSTTGQRIRRDPSNA